MSQGIARAEAFYGPVCAADRVVEGMLCRRSNSATVARPNVEVAVHHTRDQRGDSGRYQLSGSVIEREHRTADLEAIDALPAVLGEDERLARE